MPEEKYPCAARNKYTGLALIYSERNVATVIKEAKPTSGDSEWKVGDTHDDFVSPYYPPMILLDEEELVCIINEEWE